MEAYGEDALFGRVAVGPWDPTSRQSAMGSGVPARTNRLSLDSRAARHSVYGAAIAQGYPSNAGGVSAPYGRMSSIAHGPSAGGDSSLLYSQCGGLLHSSIAADFFLDNNGMHVEEQTQVYPVVTGTGRPPVHSRLGASYPMAVQNNPVYRRSSSSSGSVCGETEFCTPRQSDDDEQQHVTSRKKINVSSQAAAASGKATAATAANGAGASRKVAGMQRSMSAHVPSQQAIYFDAEHDDGLSGSAVPVQANPTNGSAHAVHFQPDELQQGQGKALRFSVAVPLPGVRGGANLGKSTGVVTHVGSGRTAGWGSASGVVRATAKTAAPGSHPCSGSGTATAAAAEVELASCTVQVFGDSSYPGELKRGQAMAISGTSSDSSSDAGSLALDAQNEPGCITSVMEFFRGRSIWTRWSTKGGDAKEEQQEEEIPANGMDAASLFWFQKPTMLLKVSGEGLQCSLSIVRPLLLPLVLCLGFSAAFHCSQWQLSQVSFNQLAVTTDIATILHHAETS